MEGDCRSATVLMSVLPMRTALSELLEAETFQQSRHLARLENGDGTHAYAT